MTRARAIDLTGVRRFTHYSRRAVVSTVLMGLVSAALCLSPHSSAIASTGPKTLLWLGQANFSSNLPSQLANFATEQAAGYMDDNRYKTMPDSVQNLGVGRMTPSDYSAFVASQSALVTQGATSGLTDVFLHLQMDSYFQQQQFGSQNKWDLFNSASDSSFSQSFANQGSFAKATGMKGVWLDVEPYSWQNLYSPEQDPAMPAYGKAASAVATKFFTLGQNAMNAMLAQYPGIQVLVSPDAPMTPSSRYLHLPDLLAGMVSAAAKANAKGIVFATERTQSWTTTTAPGYGSEYSRIMASTPSSTLNGVDTYNMLKTSLQTFDAAYATNAWTWHLAHDSVALGSQPYRADGTDMWTNNLTTFQANVTAERGVTPLYQYVYDNTNNWMRPSYTCNWPVGTITTGAVPCPGSVLRSTLP